MADEILILNEELPPDLRQALEEAAGNRDVTMNDEANRVLARVFRTSHESSGAPFRETADRFRLRVPPDLHRVLKMRAAEKGITVRGLALSTLAKYYKVESIDPHRRPRRAVA